MEKSHKELGSDYVAQKKYEKAIEELNKCESLDVEVINNKGFANFCLGNFEDALADFTLSLEVDQ